MQMKCISIDFIGAYKISRTKRMEGVFSRCIVRLFNRKTWLSRVKRNQTTQGEKKKEKKNGSRSCLQLQSCRIAFHVSRCRIVLRVVWRQLREYIWDHSQNSSSVMLLVCSLSVQSPHSSVTKGERKTGWIRHRILFLPPFKTVFFFF